MRILITGGPVHAKLDAVKIITNKFKGGLMAELADQFKIQRGPNVDITYLTTKGSKLPCVNNPTIVYHDGFVDYQEKVLYLAPDFDAVILGAAVANLIPLHPLEGKFPSHNYKPGDVIPIDFTIAPRVIDKVKAVAPKTHLFGFKLLSGVSHEELISAAYGVLLESKATAVFANDAKDLMTKYAVTKERGVHPMSIQDMVLFIRQCIQDTYYQTKHIPDTVLMPPLGTGKFKVLAERFKNKFKPTPEGYLFGTIAVLNSDGTFLTTGRGKNEMNDLATVLHVDHDKHTVTVQGERKATLNAPLLDWIFKNNPGVHSIIHYHEQCPSLVTTYQYAPPGTVRDSQREVVSSFNIEGHGVFFLLDKNNEAI